MGIRQYHADASGIRYGFNGDSLMGNFTFNNSWFVKRQVFIFEALATGVLNKWEYANIMPTLPVLGTGLTAIL